MRKYKVRAEITEREYDMETGLYIGVHAKYYVTHDVLANDFDEACEIFQDMVITENEYDVEFDDFMWEDLGPGDVFINIDFDDPLKCDYDVDTIPTITIGELITCLSKFDKDAKVYIKNNSEFWNMFRSIQPYEIEEPDILN